jgi:electron transfer flavoprotein alpha subunit
VVAIGSNIEALYPNWRRPVPTRNISPMTPAWRFFRPDPAACVVDAAKQFGADLIWFGFSESGKAAAPRVAAQLEAACATEITDVVLDGDHRRSIRPAIANKVMQRVKINAAQLVAVVRAGAFEAAEGISGTENVVKLSPPATDVKAVIKELVSDASGEIDLADADIVVSVGRGAKDQAGIDWSKNWPDDLKAGFGSSRAMVDGGFMPTTSRSGRPAKSWPRPCTWPSASPAPSSTWPA